MAENNDFCEARLGDDWIETSIDAVLELNTRTLLRCTECHGRVKAHKKANNGMRSHFEHFERHDGCSSKNTFDGTRKPHPDALD